MSVKSLNDIKGEYERLEPADPVLANRYLKTAFTLLFRNADSIEPKDFEEFITNPNLREAVCKLDIGEGFTPLTRLVEMGNTGFLDLAIPFPPPDSPEARLSDDALQITAKYLVDSLVKGKPFATIHKNRPLCKALLRLFANSTDVVGFVNSLPQQASSLPRQAQIMLENPEKLREHLTKVIEQAKSAPSNQDELRDRIIALRNIGQKGDQTVVINNPIMKKNLKEGNLHLALNQWLDETGNKKKDTIFNLILDALKPSIGDRGGFNITGDPNSTYPLLHQFIAMAADLSETQAPTEDVIRIAERIMIEIPETAYSEEERLSSDSLEKFLEEGLDGDRANELRQRMTELANNLPSRVIEDRCQELLRATLLEAL